MRRVGIVAALMILAMVVAGPAYAQEPAADAYGGTGSVASLLAPDDFTPAGESDVAPTGVTSNPRGVVVPAGGSLPFTGSDVVLMLAGGMVLLMVGIAMRRLSRAPS